MRLPNVPTVLFSDGVYGDDAVEVAADGGEGAVSSSCATHKFNAANTCEFVWQGMAVKRLFHGFLFQACETHDQARKILKAKGASHYWDQVLQHATTTATMGGQSEKLMLQLKLAQNESDDDDDDPFQQGEEDVVMADT